MPRSLDLPTPAEGDHGRVLDEQQLLVCARKNLCMRTSLKRPCAVVWHAGQVADNHRGILSRVPSILMTRVFAVRQYDGTTSEWPSNRESRRLGRPAAAI